MSFSVNTNTNALAALETLNLTQQALTRTQNEVSTGLKVSGAQDDASTFAIAQGQRGDIAGFQAISSSLALGGAAINVALQGATTISNTLIALQGKIVQAQDPTQDHTAIQNDIKSFIAQIDSTALAAQFNGVNLISSTSVSESILSSLNRVGTTVTAASLTVNAQHLDTGSLGIAGLNVAAGTATLNQTGTTQAANNDTFAVTVAGVTTTFEFVTTNTVSLTKAGDIAVLTGATLAGTIANLNTALNGHGFTTAFDGNGNDVISAGAGSVTAAAFTGTVTASFGAATISTAASTTALATVEGAINIVKTALSQLGTASNQIQTQSNFVKSLTDALTGGVGTLVDADLAAESAQLQSLQTKQQLGIQALSIANQGPGAVLSLFR
jgi:flagellin